VASCFAQRGVLCKNHVLEENPVQLEKRLATVRHASRAQRIASPLGDLHLFSMPPTSSCSLHMLFLLLQRFWKSREIRLDSAFPSKSNICVARKTRASDTVRTSQPGYTCKDREIVLQRSPLLTALVYTLSSNPVVSAFIKPPTNPNLVHSDSQFEAFDASASRIAIRCVGELHAVKNLTQEASTD